jgi:hypothetical protein
LLTYVQFAKYTPGNDYLLFVQRGSSKCVEEEEDMDTRWVGALTGAISFLLAAILVSTETVELSGSGAKGPGSRVFTLTVAEELPTGVSFPKAVAVGITDSALQVYTLDQLNQVVIYNTQTRRSMRRATGLANPNALAVGRDGLIYVADSEANRMRVIDSRRLQVKELSVHKPDSIAVLSNGDIVVASHFGRKLLHIYDRDGRLLRGFADLKILDERDAIQNAYLNRGRVLVGANDDIYFVTLYASAPTVQRFSRKGKLVSEFSITGASVELQSDLANQFFRVRPSKKYGGVRVIAAASLDASTNHLWIAVNGTSQTGSLYEYTQDGEKVGEYVLDMRLYEPISLPRVADVGSHGGAVYAIGPRGVHSFLTKERVAGNILPQTEPPACPQDTGWPTCKTGCNTASTQDDQDCTTALQAVVSTGNTIVVSSTCSQLSESCSLSVRLCNKSTGAQSDHSIDLGCPTSQEEMGYHIGGGVDCSLCTDGQDNDFDNDIDYQDLGCSSCDPSPIIIDTHGDGFD